MTMTREPSKPSNYLVVITVMAFVEIGPHYVPDLNLPETFLVS